VEDHRFVTGNQANAVLAGILNPVLPHRNAILRQTLRFSGPETNQGHRARAILAAMLYLYAGGQDERRQARYRPRSHQVRQKSLNRSWLNSV